jgi:osmotically-inducible protein OsmY
VIDELEFTPEVNAAHIGVAVREGVVTLSGHVSSILEKLAAEDSVRRVKGIKAIAQELEVRLPIDKKVADDEIAARAVRLLEWDLHLPPDAISVTVAHGVITLSGEVDWQFQRREAEYDMRKLSGVRGVINNIQLRPAVHATDVLETIQAAFARAADLEANGLVVETHSGGVVVLRGYVRSLNEHAAAERAAWSVPGVTAVENQIGVSPLAGLLVPEAGY